MASIALRIENEPIRAGKVLKSATAMLKLLEVIEDDIRKKRGEKKKKKTDRVEWAVDILTAPHTAIVKFTPAGKGPLSEVAMETMTEGMKMMHNARWGVAKPKKENADAMR